MSRPYKEIRAFQVFDHLDPAVPCPADMDATVATMADWSMLPCDILGEIALKLDTIDDFIYFSTVCHSWNHASSIVKGERNATKAMPWLLLAENTNQNPNHLRKIFNLSNNKCYHLSMPDTFGARCWGSCYGWIVLLTINHHVQLFNPLTKDRLTSFPSTLNLPIRPFSPTKTEDPYWFWRHFVHRFEVLKTPQSNKLLVAAIYGEIDSLAIARPGDQAWVVIDDMVQSVVCFDNLLYIVRLSGQTRYCDIEAIINCDFKEVKVMEYVPTVRTSVYGYDKVYLVNSGGDLLMVVRSKVDLYDGTEENNDFLAYSTVKFEVFRVDSKTNKWVKLEDFGSFSIFVGCNSAVSIPTSVAKTLRCNCIYFTDDEKMGWNAVDGFGGYDMGVYHMKTGDITKFYQGDDERSPFCPPLFFVPDC